MGGSILDLLASAPFDYYGILPIVVCCVLLFMSALVSGSEVALFSIKPTTLDALNQSNQKAEEMLAAFTYGLNNPLIDISSLNPATGDGATYTRTGQPVTDASEVLFASQNESLLKRNEILIAQEREKGTPAAKILEKVMQSIDQQPQSYKDKIDWSRLSS